MKKLSQFLGLSLANGSPPGQNIGDSALASEDRPKVFGREDPHGHQFGQNRDRVVTPKRITAVVVVLDQDAEKLQEFTFFRRQLALTLFHQLPRQAYGRSEEG